MAVLTEKTTARVKKGVAYYEGESFSLSNVDKVKVLDFSGYAYKDSLTYSRNNNDLIVSYYGANVTIKDYFGANGTVASTVKTIRTYDNSTKKRYKDYNLVTSGFLNNINSGVENFGIKKGVITGTPFADTISAADFSNPTGKGKDIGVTIKTGLGNDNVTGSIYKDTFAITGSGKKTINIKATDGNDTITGINTKDSSVVLNLSNTVLDKAINAANNAIYERVGNDLKITASETIPSKIENLTGYIWYKEQVYDNTLEQYVWKYGVCESDNPTYNFYGYYPTSFSSKPLYSYQDGNETKYTEYRDVTHTLKDAYILVGYNAYDGDQNTPDGDIVKLFTSLDAANAYKESYYDEDSEQPYGEGHDTCEITKLSNLPVNNNKQILYSYKIGSASSFSQKYSITAPSENEPIKYSDMYLHDTGSTYPAYNYTVKRYNLVTEANKTEDDIKISDLAGSVYYRQDGYFYIENPYYQTYMEIPNSNFETTYYFSPELFLVSDYNEYDVNATYYTYNEQHYSNTVPQEIKQYCTITDTAAPEYTTISTIYSYVKDGSMAYSFDAQTANYVEGATASASSTTTIKDYFKNSTAAPDVKIGLNNVKLLDALNKTDLVNIDRSTQTRKQTINGSFLNNVITGGQGNDTINLAYSDSTTGDRVNAGKGNDTINIKAAGKKVITIANEDGNDTVTGTATKDAYTFLNFTDIDVDSVTDAKNNLTYTRNKNNLVIKRTYVVDGTTKTSTTTIKDYFKNKASTPSAYFGDGSNTYVSLFGVLNGFNAGTKGSHLSDTLTGTRKNDKITTGAGTDTITGGRGNDKITVDGHGNKYVIMNTGDGTDTLDIKTTDSVYLQFTGANITNDTSARNNLTYQKSGKSDLKITSTVVASAILDPDGYIPNTGVDTDKITYYFSCGTQSYYTHITNTTGLYSYETDGETRYTTVKNTTKALSSAKLVTLTASGDVVGFLTDTNFYDESTNYTRTALSGNETLYMYKNMSIYSGVYEYVYSLSALTPTKYSELWLKPNGLGTYILSTEQTDGCISINSQDNIYLNVGAGYFTLEKRANQQQIEISKNDYNSTYYFDSNHQYVVDIDNNKNTPLYKTYNISNSYYLTLPTGAYSNNGKGIAVSNALTESSYKEIEKIYMTTDEQSRIVYSINKPKNFKEKTDSTSVIVKDYLSKDKYVYITNSNSTTSRSLANIVNGIGINIGNEKSRKAQKLTGTRMDDNIHGGSKNDKITTGRGTDTITGGKGNDKITIDGYGTKYIVMNKGDGTDTLNIKNQSTSTYIQFKGANNSQNINPLTDLTYQKSGKNDLKITYSDSPMKQYNNLSGLYFYDKYGQSDFIMFNQENMYSESSDYFTDVSSTGLYSYENENGKISYSTNKTATVALNTIYFESNGWSYKDGVGYLTTTPHEGTGYSATALSGVQKVYAYKNTISPSYTPNGKSVTEIIYTIDSSVTPTKYSDLWLKPMDDGYNDYYYVLVKTKENNDCIKVSDQDALYWPNNVPSYSSDNRIYLTDNNGWLGDPFITKDDYDKVYYFDNYNSYITDIDNDSTNGLYKEYTVSDSYFLARNGEGEEVEYLQQGDATTKALTASDYTQINTIYSSKDADGNLTYSVVKPQGFSTKSTDTSIIIKNYLTQSPYVVINGETNINLDTIMGYLGLNIGNANSKKAQKLTGSRLNDNIFGGSGKDKITTGVSDNERGDIINAGKGNDTITIDGSGKKTINIANADGNDTIIFTDNNKKTSYDYTEDKKLYLNFEDDTALAYDIKGKDLIIKRTYTANGKQASASTTLKNYFNVDYKNQLATNIYVNGTKFIADGYFDNSAIDKSAGRKAQKINGNMFANIITGGSANDTINGCGGNDVMDGKNGSDTYVVNYNSGAKHHLYDTIIINDSGDGAKDVDTLKLDIKKKDLGLLFNLNKITNPNAYTDNDIIVGSGNDAIHYLMDDQWMIVTNFSSLDDIDEIISDKVIMEHGIFATGLEKITTSDKKNITLANIKTIAQDVANWLSTANNGAGYDSTAAVYASGNNDALITMLAKYNPDNAALKEYLNAG